MSLHPSIFGLTLSEIEEICLQQGQKNFVAKQICQWLYQKNVTSFSQMSNLSKDFRQYLSDNYTIQKTLPQRFSSQIDDTARYLFSFDTGVTETAMIPTDKRITVCVSSQSGCKFACRFCATGAGGFSGQLKAADILEQIYSIDENEKVSNIVFMGMGEPLDNLDEVLKSIEILTAIWGRGMSPSRITLSSIGLPDKLDEFLTRSNVSFALSLHSPFDEEREQLLPATKKYPIAEVLKILRKHKFTQHRRLTFEYIVFKGKNHSYKHARELNTLLKGFNARINLIPYNEVDTLPFHSPEPYIMQQFQKELEMQGFICTIRNSRGSDINAACGMLAGKNKKE